MSLTLMHTNRAIDTKSIDKTNWQAISAIAPSNGVVTIEDETVDAIAELLVDTVLTNGESVSSYPKDCDDAAFVASFGPALLGEDTYRQVRTILEGDPNGEQAVALFDKIVELKLQIGLSGKEFVPAHIKAVNWIDDEIQINRCSGNMIAMLDTLGLSKFINQGFYAGETDIETFAKAVDQNGADIDYPLARLKSFVACARRHNATHVIWA